MLPTASNERASEPASEEANERGSERTNSAPSNVSAHESRNFLTILAEKFSGENMQTVPVADRSRIETLTTLAHVGTERNTPDGYIDENAVFEIRALATRKVILSGE